MRPDILAAEAAETFTQEAKGELVGPGKMTTHAMSKLDD